MSYEIYLTETFQKSIKVLKKKYRRVKDDMASTIEALEEDPTIGDPIPGWNKEIWKIRTASTDVKKGNGVASGQFTFGNQERSLFIYWQHISREIR